ncbi:MAG: serine hydrolase domain-containing protein [Bdellovibrionales bacterium]|nr:serine hydrolase domain-containing protein [Bdellovibrionales bacterium]
MVAGSIPTAAASETEVALTIGGRVKVAEGWTFDEGLSRLTAPEGDLLVAFARERLAGVSSETDLSKKDGPKDIAPEHIAHRAWHKINPNFNLKVLQKISPPLLDGWDQIHQLVYEIPSSESRAAFAVVRILKDEAFLILVDGAASTFERRSAQIQIAAQSWKPIEIQTEDLSKSSRAKFDEKKAREFRAFVKKAMKDLEVPGTAIALVQDGAVVFRSGFGVKRLGVHEQVKPETLFMIGSTTKPLTTFLTARLVDQKKMAWEDPVVTVLPEFRLKDAVLTNRLQMLHTACACTGMPRRDIDFIFEYDGVSAEQRIAQLQNEAPTTKFGETFQYSNSLVAVGGYASARVYTEEGDLATAYEKAMNDLVFGPIGMSSTRIRVGKDVAHRLAGPHGRNLDGRATAFSQKIDNAVYAVAPAGAAWSNIDDLARYMLLELNKGVLPNGTRLISEEALLRRRIPGVKMTETTSYGLGLVNVDDRGLKLVEHGGNTLGFTSDFFFIPESNMGMVILTNAGSANPFTTVVRQKMFELVYGARPKAETALAFTIEQRKKGEREFKEQLAFEKEDASWLRELVGTYRNKDLGVVKLTEGKKGEFLFDVGEWSSNAAVYKEKGGGRKLALVSAPWSGGIAFTVETDAESEASQKLLLDAGQFKFEFLRESVP